MNALTPIALQNADLLRELQNGHESQAALAEACGKDAKHLPRDFAMLERHGLIHPREKGAWPQLTPAAEAALQALERLQNPTAATGPDGFVMLHHAQILTDAANARRDWETPDAIADLEALAESIDADDLLHPLLVGPAESEGLVAIQISGEAMPFHSLIGGERRWRAIGLLIKDGRWAENRRILCRIRTDEGLAREYIALADNLQRRALNPVEEARAFARLRNQDVETSEIARRVGVTQRQVQMRLQLLELDEAGLARMLLPKTDPNYLSPTGARSLLQKPGEGHAEDEPAEAPPQAQPPAAAPVQIELNARQLLILGELNDVATRRGKDKAGYGRQVEIRQFPDAGRDADIGGLIGHGLIGFSQNYPAHAWITLAGRSRWDASLNQLRAADQHLNAAREAAGVGDVEIAALEEGAAITPWLNLPKPPAPREPLSPKEQLIALEIMQANRGQNWANASYDWEPPTFSERLGRHLQIIAPFPESGGVYRFSVYWYQLDLPGTHSSEFEPALHAARIAVFGDAATQALEPGQYLTPWLNGPFTADPAMADDIAEVEREREKQDQAIAARGAAAKRAAEAREREKAAIDALEAEAAAGPPDHLQAHLRARTPDHPLPWRYDCESGEVYDANGEEVMDYQTQDNAMRLLVLAINSAAGHATPPAPESSPSEEAAEDSEGEGEEGGDDD